jgi:hypothetical protein
MERAGRHRGASSPMRTVPRIGASSGRPPMIQPPTTVHRPDALDATTRRYASCLEASGRIQWHVDRDVIRGRAPGNDKCLPDALSLLAAAGLDCGGDHRLLDALQARTYARMTRMMCLLTGAIARQRSRVAHAADPIARAALVRTIGDARKHATLFRRLEALSAPELRDASPPSPFRREASVAARGACPWARLALALHVALTAQAHYRASLRPDAALSPLWRDAFLFRWKEGSQHAILAELEWQREHAQLSAAARDRAVDDLVALVTRVDALVCAQAQHDAKRFATSRGITVPDATTGAVHDVQRRAYRWQFIVSGAQEPRLREALKAVATRAQRERLAAALGPLLRDIG